MRTSILCWAGVLLLALSACGDDTETDPPAEPCGNGAVDPGEACDGADLGGQTCEGLGSPGGTLACTAACTLDTSGCAPVSDACGNGAVEAGEACDGADLGGQTCEGLGFDGGTLACTAACTVDPSGCVNDPEVCGNGQDEDGNGLADCLDPACTADPACTGESCSAPVPLVDGVLSSGDNTGGIATTEGSCGGMGDSPARVYAFTAGGSPGETGALHVTVHAEFWNTVYVRTDCQDHASEIACVPFYENPGPIQVDVALPGGETAYIHVDGFHEPTQTGPFDITASWEPIADEDACNDFEDNDFDDLIDCADPSCQATADCQPGTGATGSPCDASNQCVATGNDPRCFTETHDGWPEGYCSEYCSLTLNDCPSGATCADPGDGSGLGFCLDHCVTHDDCREGYHCDAFYQGCYPGPALEICDNGVDDNENGQVDCEDPGCLGYPLCPELSCDDFSDNDLDSSLDCDDPDCQPTPACVPGAGAVGVPCGDSTECAANSNDPVCLAQSTAGWPMGYCSEFCDVVANDCPSGSLCTTALGLSTSGVCLAQCVTSADCRPGYYCDASMGNVCAVTTAPESCDNGVDDNGDSLVDCDDPLCQNDPICPELLCDDLADNDSDGLLDCQDSTCQATATCAPGVGAAGAACAANSDCAADASDPLCITEAWVGWPGGYCSQFCDLATDDCPSGEACLDAGVSPGSGVCFDLCTTDADCRAGYGCLDAGGGVNVCFAN